MRVVDRCRCDRRHRSATYFARCAWPGVPVSGRGQIAIVVGCEPSRVVMVERLRWARTLLAEYRTFGCGPDCSGEHELVAINHDGPEEAP